jgi:hypothetical protein
VGVPRLSADVAVTLKLERGSPEELVIAKVLAGRPKDIENACGLVAGLLPASRCQGDRGKVDPVAEPAETVAAPSPSILEDALIPARMLNEVVYCPRLYYLEHVAGEWEESGDTLAGKRVHRRVDASSSPLPDAPALPAELKARSVTVASEDDGIVAKVDLVEASGGCVSPVDYKRGAPPKPGWPRSPTCRCSGGCT